MRPVSGSLCAIALLAALPGIAAAQAPPADCAGTVYGEGERQVCLPLGDASFADEVVSFTRGKIPSRGIFADSRYALGPPDFVATNKPGFLSLGCDGELVLRFVDNVLVDVDGPDLFVFEVGPQVEPTAVAISSDGEQWIDVGRIEGARSDIDIARFATAGASYPFVRLVNASKQCSGQYAGADIDAVATVGAAMRLSLDSAVLFDVGRSEVKPEASQALDDLASRIRGLGKARLSIEGHTDSTGGRAANQTLSEARAAAVWLQLQKRLELPAEAATVVGRGDRQPVADNGSEEGRARNRRVDILVQPTSK